MLNIKMVDKYIDKKYKKVTRHNYTLKVRVSTNFDLDFSINSGLLSSTSDFLGFLFFFPLFGSNSGSTDDFYK